MSRSSAIVASDDQLDVLAVVADLAPVETVRLLAIGSTKIFWPIDLFVFSFELYVASPDTNKYVLKRFGKIN